MPPSLQPVNESQQHNEWVPLEPGDSGYIGNAGGNAIDAVGGLTSVPNLDFLSTTFLLGNVGAPFVIGLAVGYFAKKVLKIALFLAGGAIVLLFASKYYGVTALSDHGLQNAANAATNIARESGGFLMDRLSRISAKGVSAVTGFLVGLKFG